MTTGKALDRLRALCLAFPEVTERLSHGTPTWFVQGKRSFANYAAHHHGHPWVAAWCAAPPGAQQLLVNAAPDRFFVPAYVGYRGWLGVRLDGPADWDEIADILEDAYRHVAPTRLLTQLDVSLE